MAKVTVILCDVKPCTSQAEREFTLNGQTLYVCGEQCFARFWSREYGDWKESRYRMQAIICPPTPILKHESLDVVQRKNGNERFKSDLQIVNRERDKDGEGEEYHA